MTGASGVGLTDELSCPLRCTITLPDYAQRGELRPGRGMDRRVFVSALNASLRAGQVDARGNGWP